MEKDSATKQGPHRLSRTLKWVIADEAIPLYINYCAMARDLLANLASWVCLTIVILFFLLCLNDSSRYGS